ncbi:CAP domain-containing protein [Nocardioides speluncae]|uniref:CAP domain-containing protein n=1 Tax=Nocardioides speluncae TaxID=2670337 RepID=UPI001379F301|nr:CAP domain-containing protein [Nocardioides speluncae]
MGRHAKAKSPLWVRSLPVIGVALAVALICGVTASFVLLDKPNETATGLNDDRLTSSNGGENTTGVEESAADTSSSPSRKAKPKRSKSSDPTSSSPTASEPPSQNPPKPSSPNTGPGSPSTPPRNSPSAPTSSPASSAPSGVQGQLLRLVNQARNDAGCDPVTLDSRLTRAAQLHAEDMEQNNYFSHSSQDGRTFVDRAEDQGYPSPSAENIAQGQSTAKSVFDAWMNSSGHRANIESCTSRTMGIGHTDAEDYWVQDFGF